MESFSEKRDLLQPPDQHSALDTAVLCGRYLKNRAASISKTIRSTGAAASIIASPTRKPSGTGYLSISAANISSKPKPKPQSATAYLSGVRGIAAVVVFVYHTIWAYSGIVHDGYGLYGGNHHFIQLPFLRLFHAGHAMVVVFFLIGGYVNAVKPLQLIRAQRHAELAPAVGSSLLRRGFRLYLPPMAATLITTLLAYVGVFEPSRSNLDNLDGVFYWPDFHPARQSSLWATLTDWRKQMFMLLDITHQPFWTHLDPHLWTVPLEFRASLVVSLCLAAVACCRVVPRLCIMTAVTIFSIHCDRWEVALFLTGSILAELDAARRERSQAIELVPVAAIDDDDVYDVEAKNLVPKGPSASRRMIVGLGVLAMAIIGLYLLSFPPMHGSETPGYIWVDHILVPSWAEDGKRYVHGAGAVLFLIAVSSNTMLQRPFLTSTAQYLGKISYSIYIVHGPVLHAVGYLVTPAIWSLTGMATDRDWGTGLAIATAINFVVVIGVADVFYRFVDAGSVRIATAFQKLCSL